LNVAGRKQPFASLEELLDRVHEEALAKSARTRQEVARTGLDEPPYPGGLVHVVAPVLAEGAEGLDAERELASHGAAADHFAGRSRGYGHRSSVVTGWELGTQVVVRTSSPIGAEYSMPRSIAASIFEDRNQTPGRKPEAGLSAATFIREES